MHNLKDKVAQLELVTLEQEVACSEVNGDIFSDFVENNCLPMIQVDKNGRILYCNKSMEKLIGRPIKGCYINSFYTNKQDLITVNNMLQSIGKIEGLATTIKRANGQTVKVKIYSSLHTEDNNWINSRCVIVPINEIDQIAS